MPCGSQAITMISRDFLIPPAVSMTYFWRDRDNRRDEGDQSNLLLTNQEKARTGAARSQRSHMVCAKIHLSPTDVYSETVKQCRYISGQVFSWESEVQARSIIQRDQGTRN